MSTPFDRPLNGYAFALTRRGDTLPIIAAREMGDASNWAQLIAINNLSYPYLTDDPNSVAPGVILTGEYIMVPASTPGADTTDPAAVFGVDILLINGRMTFSNGEISTVSGLENLNQALTNVLATDKRELIYHPEYGNSIRTLIGEKNTPMEVLMAANFAKEPIIADARISSVTSSVGTTTGDVISIVVEAQTIQGNTTSVGMTY